MNFMGENLGDDADTTGATYGQMAGACYGLGNIPPKWIDVLAFRELILNILNWLLLNSHNNL